jgi:hypothetical protein
MGVKDEFFQKGTFVVGYGMRTEFMKIRGWAIPL